GPPRPRGGEEARVADHDRAVARLRQVPSRHQARHSGRPPQSPLNGERARRPDATRPAVSRSLTRDPVPVSEGTMAFDLVIRRGRVCDGTGLPAYGADIGIRDGRIVKIGRIDGGARRTIDADGATVTPGFIDVHTHYDVQLDWDPLATPSSWHGTTTVLTGNCGFTLAPAKPEDVDWLAGMLSRVEGMSRAALRDGLRFRGGSFADYWRRFDGRLGGDAGARERALA